MNNVTPDTVDLLVIGGGINGAGIARDAAGRGLSVVLCEQGDLAGGTSSASSKMIHGGLRYLEHYEFRLVREALAEREVLLDIAPHLVHPLRFVLPHDAAGGALPARTGSISRPTRPASRFGMSGARASSTPTAGSTTAASWCSTRWAPPNLARRS